MTDTRDYSLTVREVLQNLKTLGDAYEQVASGTSPTGNYYFACNAADAAASIKAAMKLILQLPEWIPVSERLPEENTDVLVSVDENSDDCGMHVCDYYDGKFSRAEAGYIWGVTHWMPLPEPPEVT